jgi:hypothetical protein
LTLTSKICNHFCPEQVLIAKMEVFQYKKVSGFSVSRLHSEVVNIACDCLLIRGTSSMSYTNYTYLHKKFPFSEAKTTFIPVPDLPDLGASGVNFRQEILPPWNHVLFQANRYGEHLAGFSAKFREVQFFSRRGLCCLRGQSRQILKCTLGPKNQISTFSTTACGFLIFEMHNSWDI